MDRLDATLTGLVAETGFSHGPTRGRLKKILVVKVMSKLRLGASLVGAIGLAGGAGISFSSHPIAGYT